MRKKKTLVLAGFSLLLAAAAITGLLFLVKHEPAFYGRADVPPGKGRKDLSTKFVGLFSSLINNWVDGPVKDWDVAFSESELNSYFAEDALPHGLTEALAAQGITDPRLVMDDNRLRLAFRYGTPPWSAILSYDLKLWLAPKDVNVVCIEILGRHAGALPIATQSLLNEISDMAGRHGIEVTWYRQKGNPVALVRFQTDRSRPPAQLRRLDVKPGLISIGGLSQEPLLTNNEKKALTPVAN